MREFREKVHDRVDQVLDEAEDPGSVVFGVNDVDEVNGMHVLRDEKGFEFSELTEFLTAMVLSFDAAISEDADVPQGILVEGVTALMSDNTEAIDQVETKLEFN